MGRQVDVERLLTPDDVAQILGIPKATLYKWRLVGEGPPALRLGKHLRFRRSDFDAWLKTRESQGARA